MTVNYTEQYAVHPDDCEIYNSAMLRENLGCDDMDKIHPADFTSPES